MALPIDLPRGHHPEHRARKFLHRWMPALDFRAAQIMIRISHSIGHLTPPRVHAAVLRTWRNGWITFRRMRNAPHQVNHSNTCIYKCSDTAQDSIEHYAHCNTLQAAGERILNSIRCRTKRFDLRVPKGIDDTILFCHSKSAEEIAFNATWIYLMYSAYNTFLHKNEWGACPHSA